jgi:hypothetical protein
MRKFQKKKKKTETLERQTGEKKQLSIMRNFNKIQKQTKYVQLLKTRTPMMMMTMKMMTDNIRGRGLIFSVSKN